MKLVALLLLLVSVYWLLLAAILTFFITIIDLPGDLQAKLETA